MDKSDFEIKTEYEATKNLDKSHVVLIGNFFLGLYNFRRELIYALLDKYKVTLVTPMEESDYEKFKDLYSKGCGLVVTNLERRGKNPFKEIGLINTYKKVLRKLKPSIVITYTIKPNIYGGLACKKLGIPYFNNITGLGSSIMDGGLLAKFVLGLYKPAIKNANKVFFQNKYNYQVFKDNGLVADNEVFVPGSGINLDINPYEELIDGNENEFLYVARIMKDKGADEFLWAAEEIKKKHQDVKIGVLGFCEEAYDEQIKDLESRGIINFYGWKDNVHDYMKNAGCIVNPSYHEGMSNVCLEAAATGRSIIASNIPGCKEITDDGVTGYLCEAKNKESLLECMEKYYSLSFDEKKQMGIKAREKVQREFDRNIVVKIYLDQIEACLS